MIGESLRIALRALTANKLRTALTMLGIIIGVGAVIALLAIGQGASAAVESRFSSLGTNVLYVIPGQENVGGVRSAAGSAPTLTLEDAVTIAQAGLPAVAAIAPERGGFGQVIASGVNTNTRITGTTPTYQDVLGHYVASGEFFTDDQVEQKALVAVLGTTAAYNLFGDSDPIDQTIRVNAGGQSVNLRVIGVMQPKGGTGFANKDDQILVPIKTVLSKLRNARNANGTQQISSIDVKATSSKDIQPAIDQVTALLLQNNKTPDSFQIRNVQDQIDAQKQASETLTILLGAIAGISLVVGGIGIMNIMIVSVTERTREIGIRKAVGAKQKDILLQFLMEALVVSILGGLLGIAAGIGTSQFVEGKSLNGQEIQTVVVPASIVLAFGVSAAIGLFFGIYPASRAARLNPIEALRYE
ncbi:MAG: ABC transporter permease [Chloroflexi bacterium]|nr:ABC transporter permease [Chloroflexota bacterium]